MMKPERLITHKEWRLNPPKLAWHERMRSENDIGYRATRIRSWPHWLADVTWRPQYYRALGWLDEAGFLEIPEMEELPYGWYRHLRLRFWKVLERRMAEQHRSQEQALRDIHERGFKEGWNACGDAVQAFAAIGWRTVPDGALKSACNRACAKAQSRLLLR